MFTSVIDPASEGTINKAVGKGLNVVAIDSPVPSKTQTSGYQSGRRTHSGPGGRPR